jgi:hypothetical protein
MTYLPRVAAETAAEWPDLVVELDRWEEAGSVAPLWWRDDDAVASTRQLDRLLSIAGDAPLALAAIPAQVVAGLAVALDPYPQIAVLQHGWCHANHASDHPGAGKKSEYPAERHPVDVADEFDEGRRRLVLLFGPRALPVFVPPWNRFADRFAPLLREAGFAAISQMAPRKSAAPPEIATIDVHLDVAAWRGDRGFIGTGPALRRLLAELRERRINAADKTTPIGVLTHHLIMDAATEDFMTKLGGIIVGHRAARWVGVPELMAFA